MANNEKRCYLRLYASKLIEHEHGIRKYFIKCHLDSEEHEPCDSCMAFIDFKEGYQRG